MRLVRLAIVIVFALLVLDILVSNSQEVSVTLWPFSKGVSLSIGLVAIIGFVLGIGVVLVRNAFVFLFTFKGGTKGSKANTPQDIQDIETTGK